MTTFLKTFTYAPSIMREAIANAGQFAHVPIAEIDRFLADGERKTRYHADIIGGPWSTIVNAARWPRGFNAHYTLRHFERDFSALCPVCHTPVFGGETGHERGETACVPFSTSDLMPSFLYYETWSGYHDFAHADCAEFMGWLESGLYKVERGNPYGAKEIGDFFRRRRGWKVYCEEIRDRRAAFQMPLRFNPAHHHHRHDYGDTRFCIDIDKFTDAECEAIWPGEAELYGPRYQVPHQRMTVRADKPPREIVIPPFLRSRDHGREPQLDA